MQARVKESEKERKNEEKKQYLYRINLQKQNKTTNEKKNTHREILREEKKIYANRIVP